MTSGWILRVPCVEVQNFSGVDIVFDNQTTTEVAARRAGSLFLIIDNHSRQRLMFKCYVGIQARRGSPGGGCIRDFDSLEA